jgi:putative tricarboxylic transport membrane protein
MKLSDALSGVLAAILGIVLAGYSQTLPPMPGQSIGPGLFPTIIGAGLMVFGSTLAISRATHGRAAWVMFDEWVRRPRMTANFVLVFADLVFYALAVNLLGFFITAVIFLSVLWFAFGVRRRVILPMAIAVTLTIHYMFYSVLRVPLPWGLLGGIAW